MVASAWLCVSVHLNGEKVAADCHNNAIISETHRKTVESDAFQQAVLLRPCAPQR